MGLTEEEDTYDINYRFRYYNSDNPFDSSDKKNWYGAKAPKEGTSLEKTIATMREMFRLLENESGNKGYELIRGTGSFDDFLEQFKTLPFVHMTGPMTKEQYEEFEKTGDIPAGTISNT